LRCSSFSRETSTSRSVNSEKWEAGGSAAIGVATVEIPKVEDKLLSVVDPENSVDDALDGVAGAIVAVGVDKAEPPLLDETTPAPRNSEGDTFDGVADASVANAVDTVELPQLEEIVLSVASPKNSVDDVLDGVPDA
jgi:hypothetical protein